MNLLSVRLLSHYRAAKTTRCGDCNCRILLTIAIAVGALACGGRLASVVHADEPPQQSASQAVGEQQEPAEQSVAEISDELIAELTQVGDRMADQGDYQAALQKYTLAYQGVVSRIRGQAFQSDVEPSIFNREQLGQEMLKLMAEEYTPKELALMDQSYKVFGFVPPELDSTALMTSMLTEEVAGFYDPTHKRMVLIVEDGPIEPPSFLASLLGAKVAFDKEEQKTTLAHELTHALQDQLYDLNAMQEGIEDDDDMLLAFSALVEGDATLLMFMEMDGERDVAHMDPVAMRATFNIMSWMLPLAGGKTFRSAPPIFRDSLVFPYFQGMLFVLAVAGEGGWQAVHDLYSNPPLSTEQILYPHKYLRDVDLPQQVTLPDLSELLESDWQRLGGNCLGELQTRILLKRVPGGSTAAAGWDGDRYDVYRNAQGSLALVYASVWDSPGDAQEFASAYRRYRQLSAPAAGPLDASDQSRIETSANAEAPTDDALPAGTNATGPASSAEQAPATQAPASAEEEAAPAVQADPETAAQPDPQAQAELKSARDAAAVRSVFAEGTQSHVADIQDKVFIVEGLVAPLAEQILQRLENCKYVEKEFPQSKP